jgi:hypothetical protein
MKSEEKDAPMKLLPPPEGCCGICASKHEPKQAHNAESLFFQVRFRMRYGRDGTWADAIAHCPERIQRYWIGALRYAGKWTEPPDGIAPIAEPIDG